MPLNVQSAVRRNKARAEGPGRTKKEDKVKTIGALAVLAIMVAVVGLGCAGSGDYIGIGGGYYQLP
jgi:hypothetical protein